MNLIPLVNLLEAAGAGTQGQSIFLNMMPQDALAAILLRNPLSGTPIDYELPGYFRTTFQLIVRGRDYAATDAKIKEVIALLTLTDTTVETLTFNFCRSRTQPVSFPLSDGNLYEFSTTFDVSFTEA